MKKALALLMGCLLPWYAMAQHTLSGRIVDAATQTPLTSSTVTLSAGNRATLSNATGHFNFTNLAAGDYTLHVSYLGYATASQTVTVPTGQPLDIQLTRSSVATKEVLVTATRANEKTGTTYTNVSKQELEDRNFGQDLPYLLENTPSLVTNSDAGAGVGYTGMRIRGSDITRINVTVNGIPVNDAESHGVFFVNMPDFASSLQDVQIQRGVGTSSNGPGAFGASLNLQTQDASPEAYARTDNAFGSYNTWKNNVQFGTGLLGGKFAVDGRLSRISSDGYIDRATADLKSFYLSGGYYGAKDFLKVVMFGGHEVTYQAWNGVDEETLKTNRRFNSAGTDYGSVDTPYDNEVDDYQQYHYQLHYGHEFSNTLSLNAALHYTRGFGFYETFKSRAKLKDYLIPPITMDGAPVLRTGLVRQKWLDNHFYGSTFALQYNGTGKLSAVLGGGWNKYEGAHFGEVIWAQHASTIRPGHRYYDGDARKTDFNVYGKATVQATEALGFFGDLQVRQVDYRIDGTDDDQQDVTTRADYNFFNPKAGLTFAVSEAHQLYASVAVGHREPTRSDFTDRPSNDRAKPERLVDWEAGYRLSQPLGEFSGLPLRLTTDLTLFYMDYKDQLVLTGQLNNVGTAIRTNIPESYRTGVELAAGVGLGEVAFLSSNLSLSRNRIERFTETLPIDYDPENVAVNEYEETTISYSPSFVTSSQLEVRPLTGLRFQFQYKTVSEQFLDNTASQNRRLKPYEVGDVRVFYRFKPVNWMKEVELGLLVNNVFSKEYVANGYTFTELYGGDPARYDYNYYFPQAPRNFMGQVSLRF
ncbi:TonB-dependent receptor [Rufibacter glacialis]|uniref:TonB-dependent receptor n=1 Tax=Rufibacter glacialis TaxID=1259555 RepID=A0A5M8QN56_9BACT|nr:TonB-dependent receptor [Rufibacter glacialis]KAA6437519.1 TonB-dependent receptor [Rufibacter glacialis]GGK58655.1 TonB-dependent receptor [Rufibacter glacialis]